MRKKKAEIVDWNRAQQARAAKRNEIPLDHVRAPYAETVDHPSHYQAPNDLAGTYEAIRVIEAWQLGFCLGNSVKYIARAGKKGDRLEDLLKAQWYLSREIMSLRNGKSKQ